MRKITASPNPFTRSDAVKADLNRQIAQHWAKLVMEQALHGKFNYAGDRHHIALNEADLQTIITAALEEKDAL